MSCPSIKSDSRVLVIGVIIVSVLWSFLLSFRGTGILENVFHDGEYFAAGVSYFSDIATTFHPLTIHGALDFIPVLIAEKLWGGERYFIPTKVIYNLLNLFAAIALLVIAYNLTKSKPYQWMLLLAVAVVAPLLVGYRDIFLLLSLILFLYIADRDRAVAPNILLLVLFGVSVAFGLFWSFDRGIAGAISLGSSTLVLLFRDRKFSIALIVFALAVAVLSLSFESLSLSNYLGDIRILMETSGQWSYGWQKLPVALSIFSASLNLVALLLLVVESVRAKSILQKLPEILAFSLLSIFMLKIGMNRADNQHIYWSLWLPLLVALYVYGKELQLQVISRPLLGAIFVLASALAIYSKGYGLMLVTGIVGYVALSLKKRNIDPLINMGFLLLVLGSLGLVSYSKYSNMKSVIQGPYNSIKNLMSARDNRSSTTEGAVWVADRLLESGVKCVFDLSNSGVINGLVRRPSCSIFTYPVYAGPKHEAKLIDDLRSTAPSAIVYSSSSDSYRFDDRSMRERFPELDKFVLMNYPREACSYEYCVRYIRE